MDLSLDWIGISCNTNITFDYMKDNSSKPWDWRLLSCNIIFDIVKDNPSKPWDLNRLSCNTI